MSVAVANRDFNTRFKDIGGTQDIAATDTSLALVTVGTANKSLFIQKIVVHIKTDAAQSWSFEDSAATARKIGYIPASPGVGEFVFTFPKEGIRLTEGKNFMLTMSGAGLAGVVSWQGYERLTAAAVAAGKRSTGIGV